MTRENSAAILNSGTHPEPVFWAIAADDLGCNASYLTSTSFSFSSFLMRSLDHKGLRDTPMARTALRRRLPAASAAVSIVGIARTAALREELRKARGVEGDDVVEDRMTAFRSASAVWVTKHKPRMVIGQYTSSLAAFEAAPDAIKILLYPIAHHHWMAEHLGQESIQNPSWSEFLQGAELDGQRRRLLDAEIALATDIVVPSTFARDTFIESGVKADRVHVLPLGGEAGANLEVGSLRAAPATHSGPLRVLFAGQVNQRKGLSYLLDAVARLGGEVRLTLIGAASSAMQQRLTDEHPEVELLSPLPRPLLLEAMRAADVLVLPSLAEGFGLVALEAMTVGTPAIVSERTFGTDVITDGQDGWVVPAGSADALRAVLEKLIADRPRLTTVGAAAQRTAQRFSWERYTSSVRQFLQVRSPMS